MGRCVCFLIVGVGFLAGCNKSGEERYTPPAASARQALETALTQWRDGQAKPTQFTSEKVKVEVVDQAWAGGQKLQSFEIVGEEPNTSGGPRVFTVKLKTAKGEQTVKYYVVGIDPLWIYGEADYQKLIGS
jgi:hypothetical protein